MEACTITAPDVITAFAVPNPDHSSQSCRFFRVWLPSKLPRRTDHPIYFGLANFILSQSFRSSTVRTLNGLPMVVNAAFRCKTRARYDTFMREEIVWPAGFAPCENFDDRVLHRTFHNDSANCTKHAGRRPNISPCIPDATGARRI